MVGFNAQNKGTFRGSCLCPACSLIYRDPVQLECGHRCCESCIGNQTHEMIKCMECKRETSRSEMFPDLGFKNDMEMLNINCYLCSWTGLFKKYEDHLTMNHFNTFTGSYIGNHGVFIQYDGTLFIKIVDVKSRLNDNQCVVTSPPFYIARNDYKMCVRLYLNGDGAGQSTHVSIYLILMRGDFDAILKWPFSHQIIFGLYDFADGKHHIIESLQPDEESVCFKRPQDEMNVAAGFAQFLPLSKIQQDRSPYIREGSMYIKVMVRKNPIPTSILDKVFNIDLALSIHAQEERIQKEIQNIKPSSKLNLILKPQQPL